MVDVVDTTPCPCGRPVKAGQAAVRAYAQCCGRWHAGPEHLAAPDAESLMRSRYSAYVLDHLDYLRDTWAPRTRPAEITPNEPGLRWLGLQVLSHEVQDEHHATVRFVARSKLGGRAHRLQEHSRFERDTQGRWVYVDGDLA